MCSNIHYHRPLSPPSLPVRNAYTPRRAGAWITLVGLGIVVSAFADPKHPEPPWVECLVSRETTKPFRLELSAPTNAAAKAATHHRLFRAVRPEGWFRGLVPLYVVEFDTRVELRRLPGKGQENISDPFLFILPNPDETPATLAIAGRWEVAALRSDKSPANFAWELATDGSGRVAGRFEQLTDYRFAHVLPGKFQDAQLTLEVEYINQRFFVTGTESAGRLKGVWRESEAADAGTWQATRSGATLPPGLNRGTVPLWEWVHRTNGGRAYGIGSGPAGDGWTRTPRPLGDVWSLVNPAKAPHLTPEQSHDPRPQL